MRSFADLKTASLKCIYILMLFHMKIFSWIFVFLPQVARNNLNKEPSLRSVLSDPIS